MPIYHFIKYSDYYTQTTVSLYRWYANEFNNTITDSESFKLKKKIIGRMSMNSGE